MGGGRSKRLYVGFTLRNFGPCGTQVEKVRKGIKNGGRQKQKCNLGPLAQPRSQVLSPTRRETLVGSGHVSPRIWEITNKRLGGGADKCEICLYKA